MKNVCHTTNQSSSAGSPSKNVGGWQPEKDMLETRRRFDTPSWGNGMCHKKTLLRDNRLPTGFDPSPFVRDSHMGVSIDGGTPKWLVYKGFNPIYQNWWFRGTPILGNLHNMFWSKWKFPSPRLLPSSDVSVFDGSCWGLKPCFFEYFTQKNSET